MAILGCLYRRENSARFKPFFTCRATAMNCVTDLHIVHILRHLATFRESFVDAFEVDLPIASIWYAHNTMISFLDVCNRENNIAVTTHLQLASTLLEDAVHMYKRTDGRTDSQTVRQSDSQVR